MGTPSGIKDKVQELCKIQKRRLREKKISKTNIGDGTVICWDSRRRNYLRRYTGRLGICRGGNLGIWRGGDNETSIKIEYERDASVASQFIPCNQIVAYSIVDTKIVLQLKECFFFNRCTLQLYNQEQIDRVISNVFRYRLTCFRSRKDGRSR